MQDANDHSQATLGISGHTPRFGKNHKGATLELDSPVEALWSSQRRARTWVMTRIAKWNHNGRLPLFGCFFFVCFYCYFCVVVIFSLVVCFCSYCFCCYWCCCCCYLWRCLVHLGAWCWLLCWSSLRSPGRMVRRWNFSTFDSGSWKRRWAHHATRRDAFWSISGCQNAQNVILFLLLHQVDVDLDFIGIWFIQYTWYTCVHLVYFAYRKFCCIQDALPLKFAAKKPACH